MGQADDDAIAQRAGRRIVDRLTRVLVDDVEDPLESFTRRLGRLPAGEPLGLGVQEGHPAQRVGGDHAVPDARQRDPQRLALARDLLRGHLARTQSLVDQIDEGAERQQAEGSRDQVEAPRAVMTDNGRPQALGETLTLGAFERQEDLPDRRHGLLAAICEQRLARRHQTLLPADQENFVHLFEPLADQPAQALRSRQLRRIVGRQLLEIVDAALDGARRGREGLEVVGVVREDEAALGGLGFGDQRTDLVHPAEHVEGIEHARSRIALFVAGVPGDEDAGDHQGNDRRDAQEQRAGEQSFVAHGSQDPPPEPRQGSMSSASRPQPPGPGRSRGRLAGSSLSVSSSRRRCSNHRCLRPTTKETTNSTRKTKKATFVTRAAVPATIAKPSTPATRAMKRKAMAQDNMTGSPWSSAVPAHVPGRDGVRCHDYEATGVPRARR